MANAPPSYGVYRQFESDRCYHVAVAEKLGKSLQNSFMLVRVQSATPFYVTVVKWPKTPGCDPGIRWFESNRSPHIAVLAYWLCPSLPSSSKEFDSPTLLHIHIRDNSSVGRAKC